MAYKFTHPQTVYLGKGALMDAMEDICSLGKKALIVVGKSMIRQGHVDKLIQMLKKNGVQASVYSEILGEPTDVMIEEGVEQYKKDKCDFVIGFGGGSPLDSAKAISAMITHPGSIADYNGKLMKNHVPPIVAIPTTAGTGSEVTQFTIISSVKDNIKMLLKGPVLMPEIAVVDFIFTMGTPKNVTAATGLDALTHAIEAYTSKKAFEQTDVYAVSAIKRIFEFLPDVYQNGADEQARMQMSLAAYEAGVSFNNSSVTLVHGMSRPIGALFHVPHGISNAILLSECLHFAVDGAYERFGELGRAIGAAEEGDNDQEAAGKFLAAVENICQVCEVPTLDKLGIEKDIFYGSIDKMVQDAYDSGSPSNTRKETAAEDMKQIYKRLWK